MRAALVLVLLAGCAAPLEALEGDHQAEPRLHISYLQSDGTLGPAPGAGSVPLSWSYQDWFAGTPPPTWTAPVSAHSLLLSSVNVTITYRAVTPVVSTQIRPEFTAWFGSVDEDGRNAIVDHMFAEGPDVMLAGESRTMTFPVDLPAGGMVLFGGESLILQVASYYPDGAGTMAVELGDSRVEWWARPLKVNLQRFMEPVLFAGSLSGGRCIEDVNPTGAASAEHAFEVPAGARVTIALERLGGAGGVDLDMVVRNATGERVAYAGGSSVPEAIRLGPPNVEAGGAGPWTLVVYNCQVQVSTYAVAIFVWA